MELILEADPSKALARDAEGRLPLHLAILYNSEDISKVL
jgi:hypothetical protein